MNFILPIILIGSAVAVFFGYVDPNYKGGIDQTDATDYSKADVVFLQNELAKYNDIVNSSNKIVAQRDVLVAKKNTITEADKARLERLLPSNIDNIRLIIEISKIAEKRGLVAKNISVGDMTSSESTTIGQDNSMYGKLTLKLTVNSSYNNFLNFLQDLENNLRLLDISDISFSSTETGFYDFNISLNTYWLK
jgi:Tfp pilus assembly protein PilO